VAGDESSRRVTQLGFFIREIFQSLRMVDGFRTISGDNTHIQFMAEEQKTDADIQAQEREKSLYTTLQAGKQEESRLWIEIQAAFRDNSDRAIAERVVRDRYKDAYRSAMERTTSALRSWLESF